MFKATYDLNLQAQAFLKQSGLIKVPPQIMSQAFDYVRGAAGAMMAGKIDNILSKMKVQAKFAEKYLPLVDIWYDKLEALQSLVNQEGLLEKDLLKKASELCEVGNFPYLPGYAIVDSEPVFVKGESSLNFFFGINEDGTFSVLLDAYADPIGAGDDVSVKQDDNALPASDALPWLISAINIIHNALPNIYGALRYVESSTDKDSPIARAIAVYDAFLEDSALASKSPGARDFGTTLTISEYNLPYNLPLPLELDELKFGIQPTTIAHGTDNDWLGLWQPANLAGSGGYIGTVYVLVKVDSYIQTLKSLRWKMKVYDTIIQDLYSTTRHELQHLVQTFIDWTSGGGKALPAVKTRLSDPSYNRSGTPKHPPLLDRQKHQLRDVEFQTDLSDSIELFQREKQKLPKEVQTLFAKAWVRAVPPQEVQYALTKLWSQDGVSYDEQVRHKSALRSIDSTSPVDSFFSVLKAEAPEKYKAAVRIFWAQAV